jgi:hypothetical protein
MKNQQQNEDDKSKPTQEELDLIDAFVRDPEIGEHIVIPTTPPIIPNTPDPNAQGK